MRIAVTTLAILLMTPLAASADTLYQAAPPPTGPGHPFRLMADHRAGQIGDLVYVTFDFNDDATHTNNYSSSKNFALSQTGGTGNLNLPLLRNNSGLGGSSVTQTQQSAAAQDLFTSTMMATVTDVLPSGVLEISGDQGVVINGRKQSLHITGDVRPQDIDATDSVVSSRVANVKATFNGDDVKNKGILAKILDWLF